MKMHGVRCNIRCVFTFLCSFFMPKTSFKITVNDIAINSDKLKEDDDKIVTKIIGNEKSMKPGASCIMTCNKINNDSSTKKSKRKDKNNAIGARALVTGTACIMATNIGKVSKNSDEQKGT